MIYILISFEREIERFLDCMSKIERDERSGLRFYRGRYSRKEMCIIKTGLGKGRLSPLLFEDADLIVSTGFCGALRPSVKAGHIVISQEIVFVRRDVLDLLLQREDRGEIYKKFLVERIPGSEEVAKKLGEPALHKNISVHFGRTVTSSCAVIKPKEKLSLGKWVNALSVDMEDFFRLELSKKSGSDFISIRAAFDEAHDEIPAFSGNISIEKVSPPLQKKLIKAQEGVASSLERALQ